MKTLHNPTRRDEKVHRTLCVCYSIKESYKNDHLENENFSALVEYFMVRVENDKIPALVLFAIHYHPRTYDYPIRENRLR